MKKVAGKRFLRKVASRLCRYLVGHKVCRNRSISLHFRDKHIFVFNTEIQDGCQKCRGKHFFCEIMLVESTDTLRIKNYVEIALSRSVFEINTFLHFTQKFKMAVKNGGKMILRKVASRLCRYPTHQKFCQNCSISLRFQDKRVFAFYAEIQDGHQKGRKNRILRIVARRLCRYPVGHKFHRNRSISLRF